MKVIILSGDTSGKLSLVNNNKGIGSLHFVTKPLINFSLEMLKDSEDCHFFAYGSKGPALIKAIEPSLDWGIVVEKANEPLGQETGEVLWIRDDVLYDIDFKLLLGDIKKSGNDFVALYSGTTPVLFYQKELSKLRTNALCVEGKMFNNEAYCQYLLKQRLWDIHSFNTDQAYVLDCIESYYQLSIRLLQSDFKSLQLDYYQNNKQMIKGVQVNISHASQQQEYAYLGDHVYVHMNSQLHNSVVLCQNCYIDQCVDLRNSIVMPEVYIGAYLNINNAVVTTDSVIRIDTGVVVPIDDPKMISNTAGLLG